MRGALETGANAATAALAARGALPMAVSARRAALCRLGEFPEAAVLLDADLMASVVVPFQGGIPSTAILSFEPEDALTWIRWLSGGRAPGGPEALERFRRAAASVLAAGVEALGREGIQPGPARLQEDALVATLLGTHAPPDTGVLSAELVFASEQGALASAFYLLQDAKALHALAARLG